jgi:hypothetical protein
MEKDAAGFPQGLTNPGASRYLASRLPYRTSGLVWGKDREVLPITTGEAAMLPRYPTDTVGEIGRGVRHPRCHLR